MGKRANKRKIIEEIQSYLGTDNIIVLHGARQVGKTHIMYYLEDYLKEQGKTTYYIDLENSRLLSILDAGIENLLDYIKNEGINLSSLSKKGENLYLFIDEVQYLDNPSSLLKLLFDHQKNIQVIASGSSSFNIKSKFSDSLTGRTVNFEIYNLSFEEFLEFKNFRYDLAKLDSYHEVLIKRQYEEYIRYGGYPKIVLEDASEKKEKYLEQIVDTYIKKDVRDLAEVKEVKKFNNLLRVLADQNGNLLNVDNLSRLCLLNRKTIERYLFILEETYILKLLPVYSKSVKVGITKAPKIYFYDTGLIQILRERGFAGQIQGDSLENSIFAELVKKYGAQNIHFWRSKNKSEIDFILKAKDKMLPIEVKKNYGNFRKATMDAFLRKYDGGEYKVVSLEGDKKSKYCIYPWEI